MNFEEGAQIEEKKDIASGYQEQTSAEALFGQAQEPSPASNTNAYSNGFADFEPSPMHQQKEPGFYERFLRGSEAVSNSNRLQRH